MEYRWIRSRRKTIAVQVQENGEVLVRSPLSVSQRTVEKFLKDKKEWIEEHQRRAYIRQSRQVSVTDEMRAEGIAKAKKLFPERTAYFAERMGVTYGRITIREQKTRWGSCSSKGNLNFNWKLVLLPPELLDYVVVHELAHRKEMNHSPAFWKVVEEILPDYRERRKALVQFF